MDIEKIIKESRMNFVSSINSVDENLTSSDKLSKVLLETISYTDNLLRKYHQSLMEELKNEANIK